MNMPVNNAFCKHNIGHFVNKNRHWVILIWIFCSTDKTKATPVQLSFSFFAEKSRESEAI